MYKVGNTRYEVRNSIGRISSTFFNQHSTFNINFHSVFRISYLTLAFVSGTLYNTCTKYQDLVSSIKYQVSSIKYQVSSIVILESRIIVLIRIPT
jgi:hypothetical protein